MRMLGMVALLAVGFLAAWQGSSRGTLPRIPQPDDLTLTIGMPPVIPSRLTPLGGQCPVSSFTLAPSYEDPQAVAIHCDGFSCSTTAIYTHENGEWVVWAKQPNHSPALMLSLGSVYTENAVLIRCHLCGVQGGPISMDHHYCHGGK